MTDLRTIRPLNPLPPCCVLRGIVGVGYVALSAALGTHRALARNSVVRGFEVLARTNPITRDRQFLPVPV